ncbi:50S ribosomal protein L1 [Varanus komodoensis]|nr:50S ribosomal protein L1 [Varanus komodoensis]
MALRKSNIENFLFPDAPVAPSLSLSPQQSDYRLGESVSLVCSAPPEKRVQEFKYFNELMTTSLPVSNRSKYMLNMSILEAKHVGHFRCAYVVQLSGRDITSKQSNAVFIDGTGWGKGQSNTAEDQYAEGDTFSFIETVRPGLECLHLVLGNRDRLGILLVYHAPFCPTDSLPELTEIVLDLVLRTPRMLVLGDFNLHAETVLTGVAQDFMASMVAMGLSQHISGLTYERGNTLDLVFSTGKEEGDLRVRNLSLMPLSWSDHFLIRFELESGLSLCKGADQIVLVHPQSRMDPDGFLKALGDFPVDKAGDPVDALVELWNGEMTRAIDTITPKHPLPPDRAYSSPWYTPELWAMKQVGRCLEHRWRRSRGESDQTHLRAHYQAYAVSVSTGNMKFFSTCIASSQCRPAELFWVVQGLIHPGPKKDLIPPSKACCDDFARHFREKIAQIRHKLDSIIEPDSTEEMPTTSSKVVVRPVLKKAALEPEVAANYRPVANIPFLGKVLEWVVVGKLQAFLDETDYLDPFQSGFRPGVRSLGVLLDPELSLEAQVTVVARSAFLQLRLIHQLHPFLENNCLATVTRVGNFPIRFLQCALHGATLEDGQDTSIGTEYFCQAADGDWELFSYNPSSPSAPLAPD